MAEPEGLQRIPTFKELQAHDGGLVMCTNSAPGEEEVWRPVMVQSFVPPYDQSIKILGVDTDSDEALLVSPETFRHSQDIYPNALRFRAATFQEVKQYENAHVSFSDAQ